LQRFAAAAHDVFDLLAEEVRDSTIAVRPL